MVDWAGRALHHFTILGKLSHGRVLLQACALVYNVPLAESQSGFYGTLCSIPFPQGLYTCPSCCPMSEKVASCIFIWFLVL